jgi:hypothetical protein
MVTAYLDFERGICKAGPHYLASDHAEVATKGGILSIAHDILALLSSSNVSSTIHSLLAGCRTRVIFVVAGVVLTQ